MADRDIQQAVEKLTTAVRKAVIIDKKDIVHRGKHIEYARSSMNKTFTLLYYVEQVNGDSVWPFTDEYDTLLGQATAAVETVTEEEEQTQ